MNKPVKKLKDKIRTKLGEDGYNKLKKALDTAKLIKNIVCWVLVAVLTLAVIIFMITKFTGKTPTVFGYSLHRVSSGSMEPELTVGDVIINRDIESRDEVHIGDIVTFRGDSGFDNNEVTHRVLVEPYDNGKGSTVLVTKGDANIDDDGEIEFSSVESKYIDKIGFLSGIYNFFFSQWGLIIFLFLLALILVDEIINIGKSFVRARDAEESETVFQIMKRLEREKREEEKRERKNRPKRNNTSNKKLKSRKKAAKKPKSATKPKGGKEKHK